MQKMKVMALAALAVLLAFLAIYGLTSASLPSLPESPEQSLRMTRDLLTERLILAENALLSSAEAYASDATLIQELSELRKQLSHETPDTLKERTKNTWNSAIFEHMLNLQRQYNSRRRALEAKQRQRLAEPFGKITPQLENWWNEAPELFLAFAAVPLANGHNSATLVSYAAEGKQLRVGKRYDEEIPVLARVQSHKEAELSLFLWDQKLYLAAIMPVFNQGELVASLVLGMNLGTGFDGRFGRNISNQIQIHAYYAKRKPEGQLSQLRLLGPNADDHLRSLDKAAFKALNSDKNSPALSLAELENNQIYVSDMPSQSIGLLRQIWLWDQSQEAGFQLEQNMAPLEEAKSRLRLRLTLAALLAALLAMASIWALYAFARRDIAKVKNALIRAIQNKQALDMEAMQLLFGAKAKDMDQYGIQALSVAQEGDKHWNELFMNVEDEGQVPSGQFSLDDPNQQQLQENLEYHSLYREYMALRKKLEITAPMDYEKFYRRLERNIEEIRKNHPNEKISFEVCESDGRVLMKPILKKSKA